MNAEQPIEELDKSRSWFLKLVTGLTPEQWDVRPFPNVKSPKETLGHLVIADRVFPVMLEGKEPDYNAYQPDPDSSVEDLLNLLAETHKAKLDWLKSYLPGKDLDAEVDTVYSGKKPLWSEIYSFCTEDWYHIGQVSLIRQGTDPSWDYYAVFYGGGEASD